MKRQVILEYIKAINESKIDKIYSLMPPDYIFIDDHDNYSIVQIENIGYKKGANLVIDLHPLLRRERDSNPRKLSLQRFSRPPRSTTLPSLLVISLKMRVQRYNYFRKEKIAI